MVEETRKTSIIYVAFKFHFIALIPNSDHPTSFKDFLQISLCNFINKIISKIISNRLKPILFDHISLENFSFLENRQIHESIGVAQEGIHSMNTKKIKGMILNIYLEKAFDQTSWLYIRMLLTHLGFPNLLINWIMCCINSVSYNVLINGAATNFFNTERGLRQGCPLSPLLFLLVMEVLSRCLIDERDKGRLRGIKITYNFILTHLLFFDNIIIFMNGSLFDIMEVNSILQFFCKATGMSCNNSKSTITSHGFSPHESHYALQCFPFNPIRFEEGLK